MGNEHDNTNRGSMWGCKGFAGNLDINGVNHFCLFVETKSKNESAPSYKAVISEAGKRSDEVVAIFRKKKEGSDIVGAGRYKDVYINVFVNRSDNPNAPVLRLWATPAQEKHQPLQEPVGGPIPLSDPLPF